MTTMITRRLWASLKNTRHVVSTRNAYSKFHTKQERSAVGATDFFYEPLNTTRWTSTANTRQPVTAQLRNTSSYRDQLHVTYHDFEETLRTRGYSLYRLSLFTLAAIGGIATLYWGRIKKWSAQEGAEVATKTLGDERLLMKAEDLAKNVAMALLSDEQTSASAKKFLVDIAGHEASAEHVKGFALEICKGLAQDEEFVASTSQFMGQVLTTDDVWKSAQGLGSHIVSHPEFQEKGLDSIRQVLDSEDFKNSGFDFLADAFSKTLQSSEIQSEALESTKTVLNDPELRNVAGEAIWAATKSGVLGMKSPNGKQRERQAPQAQGVAA